MGVVLVAASAPAAVLAGGEQRLGLADVGSGAHGVAGRQRWALAVDGPGRPEVFAGCGVAVAQVLDRATGGAAVDSRADQLAGARPAETLRCNAKTEAARARQCLVSLQGAQTQT